jgi:hypothetical protein
MSPIALTAHIFHCVEQPEGRAAASVQPADSGSVRPAMVAQEPSAAGF